MDDLSHTLTPNYGPGQLEVCRRCVEWLKHDVANRIADKVERMALPSEVFDAELRDLIKLRRGQRA